MRLALNKCHTLRIINKTSHEVNQCYVLENVNIAWCSEVSDLGILIDHKLLFNQHIAHIVHKARIRARLILRSFVSRDCNILTKAFVTYVRPLLEYCSPIWSPSSISNIKKIEATQRNFTKKLYLLSNCSYYDRLLNLNLDSLEVRRLKYDITAIYKLIHNHFDIHYTDFFELVTDNNTRGHRFKVYKRHCVVNAYKHSFPNRCIDIWNNLPADVVESLSISHFKNRLDEVNLQRYCKLFL